MRLAGNDFGKWITGMITIASVAAIAGTPPATVSAIRPLASPLVLPTVVAGNTSSATTPLEKYVGPPRPRIVEPGAIPSRMFQITRSVTSTRLIAQSASFGSAGTATA